MCNELPTIVLCGQYTEDIHILVQMLIQTGLRRISQQASAKGEKVNYEEYIKGTLEYMPHENADVYWKYNYFSEYLESTNHIYIHLQYIDTFPLYLDADIV